MDKIKGSYQSNKTSLAKRFHITILLLRARCKTCFSSPPASLFGVASLFLLLYLLLAVTEIARLLSF